MKKATGPIFLRKRGNIWHYRFIGIKDFRTTFKKNRIDALAVASEAYRQHLENENISNAGTLGKAAKAYFLPGCPLDQARKAAGRSAGDKYVQENRRMLETFILPDPICKIKLNDLKRKDVLNFQTRILKIKGYTRTSARIMQALKVILKELHYREELPRDVVGGIRPLALPTGKRDRFTIEELQILFKERPGYFSEERDYDIFLAALFTGMRRGEILRLKWIDLNFVTGIINVQRALKNANMKNSTEGLPKSGKPRVTPMIQQAREIFLRQEDSGEYVFGSKDGKPYPPVRWQREITKALKGAGINRPELTAHSFRHTFNSILISQGIPSSIVRLALGWSGEAIQTNYTHIGVEAFGNVSIEI